MADLAVQWSMLGFDHADIARSCREQVAVRVAAGWPQWVSAPEQLDLDGVMRELARAQQVLAERTSRSDDRGDDAAQPVDGVWLQELAGRLIRAGWMSGGDRSEPTVAHAVNVAFLDCCIAQRPTPCGHATVKLGIIEITL